MKAAVQPFIDARKWDAQERRTALVGFDGYAALFTASWDRPSSLVPRPDGTYRRKYLLTLLLPADHRERSFHQVRGVTLYLTSDRKAFVTTDDIGDVISRDLHSVTLSMFIDDWRPREPGTGVTTKPSRRL